jgi:hypothetical protein
MEGTDHPLIALDIYLFSPSLEEAFDIQTQEVALDFIG